MASPTGRRVVVTAAHRRWAARQLELNESLEPAALASAALLHLSNQDFAAHERQHLAVRILASRQPLEVTPAEAATFSQLDEEELRQTVAEFGERYFKCSPEERKKIYTKLRKRCERSPVLTRHLRHLKRGLDLNANLLKEASPDVRRLGVAILREFVVLPTNRGTVRANQSAGNSADPSHRQQTIRALTKQFPEIAALAGGSLKDIDTWVQYRPDEQPQSAGREMDDTPLWYRRHGNGSAQGHQPRPAINGMFIVFGFCLVVFIGVRAYDLSNQRSSAARQSRAATMKEFENLDSQEQAERLEKFARALKPEEFGPATDQNESPQTDSPTAPEASTRETSPAPRPGRPHPLEFGFGGPRRRGIPPDEIIERLRQGDSSGIRPSQKSPKSPPLGWPFNNPSAQSGPTENRNAPAPRSAPAPKTVE